MDLHSASLHYIQDGFCLLRTRLETRMNTGFIKKFTTYLVVNRYKRL